MQTSSLLVLFPLIFSFASPIPSACAQTDQTNSDRKVINRVSPGYPRLAREMNLTGTVRLGILVGGNGTAKTIEVKGGSPVLIQSAEDAPRSWRWEKSDHETDWGLACFPAAISGAFVVQIPVISTFVQALPE